MQSQSEIKNGNDGEQQNAQISLWKRLWQLKEAVLATFDGDKGEYEAGSVMVTRGAAAVPVSAQKEIDSNLPSLFSLDDHPNNHPEKGLHCGNHTSSTEDSQERQNAHKVLSWSIHQPEDTILAIFPGDDDEINNWADEEEPEQVETQQQNDTQNGSARSAATHNNPHIISAVLNNYSTDVESVFRPSIVIEFDFA